MANPVEGAVAMVGGTIRRRVARILALPAVVVLVLLAFVATGQVQGYRTSQATAQSVRLTLAVQDLVYRLAAERGITAAVLGGNPSFRNELPSAREQVNQQRTAVLQVITGDSAAETQLRSALQQLDGLGAVRAATDAATAGRAATFQYFTDRISALSSVDVGLDRAADDQLRRGASALQALQDLAEGLSQERAFLNGVYSAGGFAPGEFVQFAAMRATKESALSRFQRLATVSERQAGDFVFSTGAARITAYFEQVAVEAADGHHIVVNPQSWWSGMTTVLDDLRQLQQHVGSQIQIRAHDLQQGSAQRIAGLVIVVLLTFAGSIYLAALASMSITRPLASLAAEANSVAADRLPAAVSRVQAGAVEDDPAQPPPPVQIPTRATEEIRSVAAALDRLQSAAYGLATEQALQRRRTIESLANLGRRNQNLIRRQLGFITALEHEEIDPSALANLFELDHLATRMRRNAASLLVLVGASSPRQWSQPVPIADVIRAAVSEVEEYRRVVLRRVDDALVVGTAVGSVAHLLSELIENGLTFSPPDSEVEVQGRRLVDGYLIAITDQGVGMNGEDLRQANRRLRGEEDFIAAPTRFLGHFVVGQLAGETGTQVELLPSPVTGVTARVTLPAGLLATSLAVEGRGTAPAVAGPRHATGPLPVAVVPPLLAPAPTPLSLPQPPVPVGPVSGPIVLPPAARTPELSLVADDLDEEPGPALPAELSSMLSAHPLVHPFAGDLTVTAPNDGFQVRPTAAAQAPATGQTGSAPGYQEAFGPATASVPTAGSISGPATGSLALDSGHPADTGYPTAGKFDPTAGELGPGDADADAARTRNGLRKRLPREARPSSAQPQPVRRVIDLTAAARPAVDDSPAEVRARLTALRAGMQRGQVTVSPGQAAGSDHVGRTDG
ncbi:MAG TPA: nitrate- and nitrite sensing domain-containing protein [Kineosporiaceae bacterium]|nr:nitrate- and nitrite sensing domain-containing protein [Kineosporiaceae bacterium]